MRVVWPALTGCLACHPEQATLYSQALAVVQSDNTGRQAQDTPTGEGGPSAKRQRIIAGPSLGDI